MFKAFDFSLPTNGTKAPAGPEWLHEIKCDGSPARERNGDRVRLVTGGSVARALSERQKEHVECDEYT